MSNGFANPRETWDARFARYDYIFGRAPNVFLTTQLPRLAPGERVLCAADGEGRNSVWLAQQGFEVDAFDVADRAVAKAQALSRRQGVSVNFTVSDVDGFAWPEAVYDGVAAIFVQFADPATCARLFERIVRSLKSGGVLVLQGYTPKQLDYRTGGPPILSHLYSRELLESAFTTVRLNGPRRA